MRLRSTWEVQRHAHTRTPTNSLSKIQQSQEHRPSPIVSPPLQSFASELVGLFVRKARATKQFDSKKIKDSFHHILPPHVIAAFKHCATVTQEKMASPLNFNPDLPRYWSSHPRDTVFGAFTECFSSSFSGFCICHPIYDDDIMHLTLRHAIYSTIKSPHDIPTATFMLLPCSGSPHPLQCRFSLHLILVRSSCHLAHSNCWESAWSV